MDELDRDESDNANSTDLEKYSQPIRIIMEQPSARQQQIMAMDVYGQQIEPICNYHTCHHKFSVHGPILAGANAVTLSIMPQECQ